MMSTPPTDHDKVEIRCGSSSCYNFATIECPVCKLYVCKKHEQHIGSNPSESVVAHSRNRQNRSWK